MSRQRWRAAMAIGTPLVLLALLPSVLAEPWQQVSAGAAGFDDAVTVVAGVALGLVLAWVVLVLASTALAAMPGLLGEVAQAVAARCTPAGASKAAALVLGVTVASGPVSPYEPSGAATAPAAATVVAGLSVDRPLTAWTPLTAPATGRPVQPEVAVDRPRTSISAERSGGWVPPPYRPAPPQRRHPRVDIVTAVPRDAEAASDEVVVRRGDTLWDIAARHLRTGASDAEIAAEWPRWYAANRRAVGPDPDLILPGTVLRAPPSRS